MGLTSLAAGAAIDAAAKKAELKRRLKGRTPDQQKVIKYFFQDGGCLSKKMTDAEYDELVKRKLNSVDLKKRALDKIGLDESELNEIEPVTFSGPIFNDKDAYALYGKDGVWRSSKFEVSWVFFSDDMVFLYQYIMNMDEDGKKERTEQYFYKDITNFSSSNDTVEKEVPLKTSCTGKTSYGRKNVEYDVFSIIVPGDKLTCSMRSTEYTEKAIKGMRAKLMEKKRG